MKTILVTLSLINMAMGALLVGLLFVADGTPVVVVLGLGLGLLIQGGYTLAYVSGRLERFEPWSLRALLVGQTVALVIGVMGFASSALYNIDPPAGDYEYGPLTVSVLIALQALATLGHMPSVSDRGLRPSEGLGAAAAGGVVVAEFGCPQVVVVGEGLVVPAEDVFDLVVVAA